MGVVVQAIRDSARGEACTLRTYLCNYNDDTTVFCHGPRLDTAGMGQKVDDYWGAYGCSGCHTAMDEHKVEDLASWVLFWLKAIQRTQRRLYEKGIMSFPERAKTPKTVNKIVPRPEHFRR